MLTEMSINGKFHYSNYKLIPLLGSVSIKFVHGIQYCVPWFVHNFFTIFILNIFFLQIKLYSLFSQQQQQQYNNKRRFFECK